MYKVGKVGDVVKINFRTRIEHSISFETKFLGPFKITKILGDLNYKLEQMKKKK
jgi:hypothetical protein